MTEIKTDKHVIALKADPNRTEYHVKVYGKPRLFIRVRATKNGESKEWVYRYTKDGRTHKEFLGNYPIVGMATAFEKWQALNELIAQDIDPKSHYAKQAKEKERQEKNKFSLVCMTWAKSQAWGKTTAKRRQYNLNLFINHFGDTPIHQITTADLIELLQNIQLTHRQRKDPTKPSDKAERCRGMIVDLFAWATLHEYCTNNPAEPIANAKTSHILETVHYGNRLALVKPHEFGELIHNIKNDNHMTTSSYHCLMLLAYTGVRIGDIRAMKWADLDLDNAKWELTPIKGQSDNGLKMVKQMTVPLSKQVIKILQEQYRHTGQYEQVFHSTQSKHGVISDNTTNQALHKLGYKDKHTSHGFRSSAKTLLMQELDYNDMITEMVLGHVIKGGENPYMRADLYAKRCELMQTWADYIDDLADGKDTTHYKGVYRKKPTEILQALINMIGKDELLKLLQ